MTGNIALGISLVSYAGQIRFVTSCDQALDLDTDALLADMTSAATEL